MIGSCSSRSVIVVASPVSASSSSLRRITWRLSRRSRAIARRLSNIRYAWRLNASTMANRKKKRK